MAKKPASTLDASSTVLSLWPHQERSRTFFASKQCGFDTSDPGTGKTAVHIRVYAERPKPRGRCLVICPKTLMEAAWAVDIERFAPGLTFSLAYAEQRDDAFKLKTDVVIMNTDGVKWFFIPKTWKLTPEAKTYLAEFDHLIIDEITTFKHNTSQRSKAMVRLSKFFRRRFGLTGTPNPNSVTELHTPLLILDGGARLGTSFSEFKYKTQVSTQTGPDSKHVRWDDKPGSAQAVDSIISDITIRHAFEDVMTHVPKNFRHPPIEFDLAPKAMKAYLQLERDGILQLESGTLTAVHAAALREKLLQGASGAVYTGDVDDEGNGAYVVLDTKRYELIADILEERKHSVVFFRWRHQREQLQKTFKARGIKHALIDGSVSNKDRNRVVSEYQDGKYQTILLHPRTGAHGLTLTTGDTTLWTSPIYEADLFKQGNARVYRGQQDKITNTLMIEARNTIEREVYLRRDGKYERMEDLLDLMKMRHKK